MNKLLPQFKTTFILVGITYIMLSLGLFAKGLISSMAEFKVPEIILNSPHYVDAITWVYVHMLVLGILILCIGLAVKEVAQQKWISPLLFVISMVYTYLDFRTSDSSLGNGLYQGESSVVPAFIGLLVSILFLLTSLKLFLSKK